VSARAEAPAAAADGAEHRPEVDVDGDQPTELATGGPNSVGVVLGLVADEWTLLIVQQALLGARRFGEWKTRLPISNSVLTNRLAHLSEVGILRRRSYQQNPVRFEYRLTARGRALWPVLLSIWEWERRWDPAHAATLPQMVHRRCGQVFRPLLTCDGCSESVGARDVIARFGPSGTWERSIPAAATRRRSCAGTNAHAGLLPDTMALIGNRWSFALLGAALGGATRFGDFAAKLGAPPTVVADRLRTFCQLSVLATVPDAERRDWVRYHLTDKGRAFFPVVVTTLRWGDDWFRAPEGPALEQSHRGCGAPFVPRLVCHCCRQPLSRHDISIEPIQVLAEQP
jgi:DNA-binding HxlR family transcriptional regulator